MQVANTQHRSAHRPSGVTDPLKVAILGSFPPLRAISSYCLGLAAAMAQIAAVEFISFKRIYPTFIYPGKKTEDPTLPQSPPGNLTVRRRLTWYNPLTWLRAGLLTDADLLHAQWWSLPLAPIYLVIGAGFKLRRKPVIYTVHNVLPHDRSGLYILFSRILFALGDHFIVHTTVGKRQLMDLYGIRPHRISVIPHGVLDFQVRKRADRQQARKEMGIASEEKVILLFGTIRSYKGVDTAISAFTKAAGDLPGARLLIAGNPWESWAPYAAQIEAAGIGDRVTTVLDYIPSDEVHRYFEAADLVLLPYHHFDSQSGVGATAVAFDKPMIVSRAGGLPELVVDGRWTVPPGDAGALARAIVSCFKEPETYRQMTADAEAVRNALSWPHIAKKTMEVYGLVCR